MDLVTVISQVGGAIIVLGGVGALATRPLRSIGERLDAIEGQVHPDGGSSMADGVARVERAVDRLTERFDEHLRDHSRTR